MTGWISAVFLCALLLAGCTHPAPWESQTAEHRMVLSLEPDGAGAYVVDVPFLVHHRQEGVRVMALERLRETFQVTVGEGTFEWKDNQTRILVWGEGPMVLEVNRTFRGDVREREAFFDWRLQSMEIRRIGSGGPGIEVMWDVDFSGGTGHTCWAWETYSASLQEGAQAVMLAGKEVGANGSWIGLCQ